MEKLKTCWYCGRMGSTKNTMLMSNTNHRYFHNDCFESYKEERETRLKEYVSLKILVMHERALRMLEKQNANLELYYDESIAVCEKAMEDPNKFLSSHEMITAMELLRNEVRFKKEYKILNHRVDFLIPEFKVVLEIDGHTHNYKKIEDTKRDAKILNELNKEENGWEVVRIPTNRIEQNIQKLLPAIAAIKNYKQELRRKNNGFIPSKFSDRDKKYYEDAFMN